MACWHRVGSATLFSALWLLIVSVAGAGSVASEPPRAMLGVIPSDVGGKLIVKDVYVGGPAQVAGIRPGDRIIAINDKAVNTSAELFEALAGYDVGAEVELRASRDGWSKQLRVPLGKREDVARLPLSLPAGANAQAPVNRRAPIAPPSRDRRRDVDSPYYRYRYQRW
jgi:predicted metalloprotease with PDZ domain